VASAADTGAATGRRADPGRGFDGPLPFSASATSIAPFISPRGPPPPLAGEVIDPEDLIGLVSCAWLSRLGRYFNPARARIKTTTTLTAYFTAGFVVLSGRAVFRRCGMGVVGAERATCVKPAESLGRLSRRGVGSGPACVNAVSVMGTVSVPWQLGHWICCPDHCWSAEICCPHWPQENLISAIAHDLSSSFERGWRQLYQAKAASADP